MKKNSAFSLVEIVLALGIISFALISILGLFALGMSGDRKATDDTALASMSVRIVCEARIAAAEHLTLATNYFFDTEGETNATTGYGEAFFRFTRLASPSCKPSLALIRSQGSGDSRQW